MSDDYGRSLDVDGLEHLLSTRLLPLGLVIQHTDDADVDEDRVNVSVAGPDSPALPTSAVGQTPLPTAQPLLSLSLRGSLVPARWVPLLAKLLSPLFWPPVVVLALVAVVALDIRLLRVRRHGVSRHRPAHDAHAACWRSTPC